MPRSNRRGGKLTTTTTIAWRTGKHFSGSTRTRRTVPKTRRSRSWSVRWPSFEGLSQTSALGPHAVVPTSLVSCLSRAPKAKAGAKGSAKGNRKNMQQRKGREKAGHGQQRKNFTGSIPSFHSSWPTVPKVSVFPFRAKHAPGRLVDCRMCASVSVRRHW